MRVDGRISIAAATLWTSGEYDTAEQAQARGAVAVARAHAEGLERVPVSRDLTAPHMAVEAARTALARAGTSPEHVDFLSYAWIFDQGPDNWAPAHRVARLLGARNCVAHGIQQMSNGGAAALEACITHMLCEPRSRWALTVTADTFTTLPFDRWADLTMGVLGDAATAVVLTRGPGMREVHSISSSADADLELTFPGRDPFAPPPHHPPPGNPFGDREVMARIRTCVGTAVRGALDDADLDPEDPRIGAVLLPRLMRTMNTRVVIAGLPFALRGKAVFASPATGHLGAGDMPADLADDTARTPHADHPFTATVSIGIGFTATCIITRAARRSHR